MILKPVGTEYVASNKKGGGSYTVVGHMNCSRCTALCEERERQSPTKKQKRKGHFWSHYVWCWNCGLYEKFSKEKVHV